MLDSVPHRKPCEFKQKSFLRGMSCKRKLHLLLSLSPGAVAVPIKNRERTRTTHYVVMWILGVAQIVATPQQIPRGEFFLHQGGKYHGYE